MLPEQARLLGLKLSPSDLLGLARTAIPALVVLAMLLFILRPMIYRLTAPAQAQLAGADDPAALSAPGRPGATAAALPGMPVAGLLTGPETDEAEMALANVEGSVRANAMRRLAALVEQHPEEAISIVRSWLRQEPA
jgi:flagellar M-ring protein FliF